MKVIITRDGRVFKLSLDKVITWCLILCALAFYLANVLS